MEIFNTFFVVFHVMKRNQILKVKFSPRFLVKLLSNNFKPLENNISQHFDQAVDIKSSIVYFSHFRNVVITCFRAF